MLKAIRVLYGPNRGLVKLPAAEADKAIKEGWAVDPFRPTPVPIDPATAKAAADKAARRWQEQSQPKPKAKPETVGKRAMDAETPASGAGTYKTRVVGTAKRGRPRKS